jgi:hypothetical protein
VGASVLHNFMSPHSMLQGQLYLLPLSYVRKEMKQENRIFVEVLSNETM